MMQKQTLEVKLNKALMDEYHARDTYQKIIDTFGDIRPFSNIVLAEQRHIEFLLPLYKKYAIAIPPEPDTTGMAVPDTVAEACKIAVQAEEENISLYYELFAGTDEQDVLAVFQRLQAASRDNHLPAFRRCLERGTHIQGGDGINGRGSGRRRGLGKGGGHRGGRGCCFV